MIGLTGFFSAAVAVVAAVAFFVDSFFLSVAVMFYRNAIIYHIVVNRHEHSPYNIMVIIIILRLSKNIYKKNVKNIRHKTFANGFGRLANRNFVNNQIHFTHKTSTKHKVSN